MKTFTTKTAEETQETAQILLSEILNNKIVHLYGQLGSGKTTFVKGLAKALNIQEAITSPTYTYQNSYSIPTSDENKYTQLTHFDLYRLPETSDDPHHTAATIGLEDAIKNPQSIVLIEWSERLPITEHGLHISFENQGNQHLIVASETRLPNPS